MGVDVGVDAVGVGLELVELVGGEDGDGAVGGGAELEDALLAIVLDHGGADDLGEGAGAVTAEGIHLEEAVGGGDVALGEEQVVEVGRVDGGDTLGVAGDGDGGGEAGDGDGAVEEALVGEEVGAQVVAEDDGGDGEGEGGQEEQDAEGDEDAAQGAGADGRLQAWRGVLRERGLGAGGGGAVAEGRRVVGVLGRGGIHRL